ncbi:DUF554 domain-containing protein [Propionivibrio limicola]|uniref:DUF554 domain-containing protein n=1 Tax=Propionivibrio limicola TaxID=167645 RepID=UPI001291ABF0|nr:DUF554 domain-containing protein [Propionivibrio limicola]
MLGPLVNSAALIVGGVSGALLGRLVPRRVKEALPLTCGVISMGVGVVLVNKVQTLPAVALALILGALLGELFFLERGLELAVGWARKRVERAFPAERGNKRVDDFVVRFVTIMVLFCASGMGVFGATHEGMTGEPNILLAKSVLDLFTAMVFATELGFAVALIALPQIAIQAGLYFSAYLLIPLATPAMLGDFSACGGLIMLATGLRICGIKIFPIVNMLPALLLIMPVSALWSQLFT